MPIPWTSIGLTCLPSGTSPAAGQVLLDPSRGVLAVGTASPDRARHVLPADVRDTRAASLDRRAGRRRGVVIVVDPAGGPHPPGQTVVDSAAIWTAAQAAATSTSAGRARDPGHVEIRLQTNDRLAAPAAMTANPPVSRWRIVAPAGLTPVIEGDLTIGLPGASVELAGFLPRRQPDRRRRARRADAHRGHHEPGGRDHPVGGNGGVDAAAVRVAVPPGPGPGRPVRLPGHAGRLHRRRRPASPLSPCGPEPAPPAPVPAVSAADRFPPQLQAAGVTFAGPVAVDTVQASDCLFTGGIHTVMTSAGCLRFCHLGDHDDPAAHPPAHQCLSGPLPTMMSSGAESVGYYAPVLAVPGDPGVDPVLSAASDGGEIGAYHHARRGPLALLLAQRLAEMTPLTVHPHLILSRPEE